MLGTLVKIKRGGIVPRPVLPNFTDLDNRAYPKDDAFRDVVRGSLRGGSQVCVSALTAIDKSLTGEHIGPRTHSFPTAGWDASGCKCVDGPPDGVGDPTDSAEFLGKGEGLGHESANEWVSNVIVF